MSTEIMREKLYELTLYLKDIKCAPVMAAEDICLVATDGDLFTEELRAQVLVNEIVDRYRVAVSGDVRKDLCFHIIQFIQSEIKFIEYYCKLSKVIAKTKADIKILNELTSRKNKSTNSRMHLLHSTRSRLTRAFPIMFIRCLDDALTRMLYDRKTGWLVDVPAVSNTYFSTSEFISLVLVKQCALKYIANETGTSFDNTTNVYENESEESPTDSGKNLKCLHNSIKSRKFDIGLVLLKRVPFKFEHIKLLCNLSCGIHASVFASPHKYRISSDKRRVSNKRRNYKSCAYYNK